VFFYKNPSISEKDRWYFLIGHDKGEVLYLLTPQSEVDKRLIARGETRDNLKSLVIVSKNDYCELAKESVFDCNSLSEENKTKLIRACERGIFQVRSPYSNELRSLLLKGVSNSSNVKRKVKRNLGLI
jgi:hypothetical protein